MDGNQETSVMPAEIQIRDVKIRPLMDGNITKSKSSQNSNSVKIRPLMDGNRTSMTIILLLMDC